MLVPRAKVASPSWTTIPNSAELVLMPLAAPHFPDRAVQQIGKKTFQIISYHKS